MTDNKIFFAPSLTWRPTADTSLTVLSQYSKIDNKGYQQYVPGQVSFLPTAAAGASGEGPIGIADCSAL